MFYFECPRSWTRTLQLTLLLFCVGLFISACGHSTERFLAKGEEYLQKRKFHDALMQFRSAVDSDKDSAKAHWGMARSYENLGEFSPALDELRRTVELDPTNYEAKARLGNYFLLLQPPLIGEADKIQAELQEAAPTFVEGHILRASIMASQNRPMGDVVKKLNDAIAIDPARVESYISLSRYYMGREMAAEAESAIKTGISKNPAAALGYTEYGRFLMFAGRRDEAEAQHRAAIAAEPGNIAAHEALADLYVLTRQFEKAEAAHLELVRIQDNSAESRLVLGEFYTTAGMNDRAINVFNSIIADTPSYARARYRLGQIYLEQKDFAKVSEQLDALFKINENDTEALMLKARMLMADNKPAEAVKQLEEILKKLPSERDALFYIAQAKITLGQVNQAQAFIADLEKFHPDLLKTGLLKIQAARASSDPAGALRAANDLYAKVSVAVPNGENTVGKLQELELRALSARGLAYLELGRFAEARTDLEQLVRVSPSSTSAMINLAKVHLAEKNTRSAVELYERALNQDGNNFDALSAIVAVALSTGKFDEAKGRVDNAISKNAGRGDVLAALHFLRSTVFTAAKDNSSAEAELRSALELDPGYLPAYSSYAALLVARNETAAAIEQYQKIVAANPSAPIYTLLGILEESRSQTAEAERYYRRALEISAETPIAANNLAWLIAENQGNLDEALQLASGSVSRNPEVAGFYDTLGWVYLKKGLYSPAIEQLRKAVALDEKHGNGAASPAYRVRLAMALASAGDIPSAKREAETSLRFPQALSQNETAEAKRVLATL